MSYYKKHSPNCILILLILFICAFHLTALSQTAINPIVYYTFDSHESYKNNRSAAYNSSVYGTSTAYNSLTGTTPTIGNHSTGNNTDYFIVTQSSTSLVSDNISGNNALLGITDKFTVEFMFKLNDGDLNSSQKEYQFFTTRVCNKSIKASLKFLPVPSIFLEGDISIGGSTKVYSQNIILDGAANERGSLDYYVDNDWHHIVFRVDANFNTSQTKSEVWVDGIKPGEFENIETFNGNFVAACTTVVEHGIVLFSGDYLINKFIGSFDEFAFYNDWISDAQICEHNKNAKDIVSYKSSLTTTCSTAVAIYDTDLDENEFAHGHDYQIDPGDDHNTHKADNTTNSAIDQLLSFPIPRFKKGVEMHPNMDWMNPKYMGGLLRVTTSTAVSNSIIIQDELAKNWNYLFNILNTPNDYDDFINPTSGTFADKWADYVKDKNYPISISANRNQLVPSLILSWINISEPYITYQGFSTNVESSYLLDYGTNMNCSPNCSTPTSILFMQENGTSTATPTGNQRKYWNPTNDPVNYSVDGQAMSAVIDAIYENTTGFNKKINYISENNELPGITEPYVGSGDPSSTVIPPIFTLNCPSVCEYNSSSYSSANPHWSGWIAEKRLSMDKSSYRDIILSNPHIGNPLFLTYGTDADGSSDLYSKRYYWPIYREIQTQTANYQPHLNKFHLSTPDYYPQSPSTWRDIRGFRRGWQWFIKSRSKEYALNDSMFAPFVSAGYYKNENHNIRPAQYMGVLKCIGLLGAGFYHAGFFNTGALNSTTNKPANPMGYIWQATTPSYAQALLSRAFNEYFINGKILEGDMPLDIDDQTGTYPFGYSFKSNNEPRQLIVVRQNGASDQATSFLITGTIQPNSNQVGNAPLTDDASIDLQPTSEGTVNLQFEVRRQGSTYIYDQSNPSELVFWQLDKWHQYEHPEWWTKDFAFEAEVMDNLEANCTKNPLPGVTIKTIDNTTSSVITNGNFNDFTSYVSFETPSPLEYRFQPRNDGVDNVYTFFIKARNADVTNASISGLSLTLTDLTTENTVGTWKINCVNSSDWNWYGKDECSGDVIQFTDLINDHQYMLSIVPATLELEIDMIYLTAPNSTFAETVLSPCNSYDFDITDNSQLQSANTIFGGINVANSTIHLAEDVILEIDYTVTFENCIFTMEGNNYIIVTGTNDLSLLNCGIHSCGEMWNDLRTSGASNIVCTGTSIEDALTALRLSGHDQADINNSLFCKNWNDIVLSNNGLVSINNTIFDYPEPFLTLPDPMVDLDPTHIFAGNSSNLEIENSSFRNSSLYSILVSGRSDIDVSGCSFERNKQVFTYDNPVNGANVNFQDNKIKSAYDENGSMKGEYGISIWGSTNNDINFNISNNSITDYTRPVLIMNIDNTANTSNIIEGNHLVLSRTIEQLGSDDYRGIKLVNCIGVNLSKDTVIWSNNPNDNTDYSEKVQGIRLEASTGAEVSENLIEKTGAAISTFEDCQGIEFKCNTMSKCWNGVYLDPNGASNIISTQGTSAESWNNRWIDIKNEPDHYKVNGVIDPQNPIDWYYESGDPEFSPDPISSALTNFITLLSSTSTIGCDAPDPTLMRFADDSLSAATRDSLYGDAVGDSTFFSLLDPEFIYKARLEFIESVMSDTSILYLGVANDSIYIAQYDSLMQTNMGKMALAYHHVKIQEYSEALNNLEEIVSPNTIESNLNFALETYINYYAPADSADSIPIVTPPDSSTLEQMNEIANQHPFYGGKAVYMLQSLLHKDIEGKLPQQRIKANSIIQVKESNELFSGNLYPNPAKGIVQYDCVLSNEEKADFTLNNTIGSEIIRIHLQNSTNAINIQLLKQGIYFYKVSVNGVIKDKGKLIVN